MKKILCLLLVLIIPAIILCGCGTKTDNYEENISTRFVIVEKVQDNFRDGDNASIDIYIVVDKETSIMYLMACGYYRFDLETMLNADGTPMIWEGDL